MVRQHGHRFRVALEHQHDGRCDVIRKRQFI